MERTGANIDPRADACSPANKSGCITQPKDSRENSANDAADEAIDGPIHANILALVPSIHRAQYNVPDGIETIVSMIVAIAVCQ